MDIHEILQTAGQYLFVAVSAVGGWIEKGWTLFREWIATLPLPTAIKLFSNDTANKYLFFGIILFLLIMNIRAFALFAADKSNAKRKQRRVRESKLFKACFFGGAIGGMMGMQCFRHKTQKRKFSVGVPVLFVIQLVLYSFVIGFLGFWTFF